MSEFKAFEDKPNFAQLEHLQAKYVGTGSADITKDEWLLTQHRDTYASLLGHHNQLVYMAAAEGQSVASLRFRLLRSMISPTLGKQPTSSTSSQST